MHRFEDKGNLPMEMEGCGQFQSPSVTGTEWAHKMKGDFKKRRKVPSSGTARKDRLRKDPGQPEPGAVASEHVELDETFKCSMGIFHVGIKFTRICASNPAPFYIKF